ncbi:MAG: glycosyltransferase family 2 protein [Phycisphaerae bacterium]
MNRRTRIQISFVMATHNRCGVLARTLRGIAACGLDDGDFEILVVDNASSDGTAEVAADFGAQVIALDRNGGSCAKAFAVDRVRGRYVVFLDDDSYPRCESVYRMINHFERDARLAAAGYQVHLPDGRREGGALPGVFLGCGVGLRVNALRQCGGLDRTFFMQAEEYDLAFRLVGDGWRVVVFDDLHVEHLKTPQARRNERTTYYDTCNNLRVAARYLPRGCYRVYRADWRQRYGWLARREDHGAAYRRGARMGRLRGLVERPQYRARRLSAAALERFFCWAYLERKMAALAGRGIKRIVFADLGKNVYAYVRAASRAGIAVAAIGDDRFAAPRRAYRGIPIISREDALALGADGVVVANSSPVHGTVTYRALVGRDRPVYHWFVANQDSESHRVAAGGFDHDRGVGLPERGAVARSAAVVASF